MHRISYASWMTILNNLLIFVVKDNFNFIYGKTHDRSFTGKISNILYSFGTINFSGKC